MQRENPDNKTTDDLNAVSAEGQPHRRMAGFMLAAVALCLVTVAAYWGVSSNGFVSFDDPDYVTDNYHVKLGLTLEGTKWAFTKAYVSNWHPLTWLSHMLDVQLFGLQSAAGHHFVSLGFHLANTLLLLGFLVCTTGRRWPSLFVAALFALHPLHVESVAWVSERKDVLSTFFWLTTMLAYAWYARKPSTSRYILPVVLMALGLMAKPMLVTLPLVLLLLDYWPLGRIAAKSGKAGGVPLARLIVEKIPFAALSAASAAITMFAQERSINSVSERGFSTLVTNAVVSYGRYVQKMFWPSDLAVYYPHPFAPLVAAALLVGSLMVVATLLAWRYRRQYPYLLAGWLWYVVTLVPVIGLVQVGGQSHADRYTYIPLVGLFVIMAWGAASLLQRVPSLRGVMSAGAVVVSLGLAALTWHMVGYWKDSITLFERALKVVGEDGKLEATLGARLVEVGRSDEGIAMLERAVKSKGHDGSGYNALAVIYLHKGDRAKAIEYFTEATKYDWTNIKAERNLGAIYSNMKDYKQAAEHLRKAVALDPYTGETYALLAVALSETGEAAEAQAACDKAMKMSPEMAVTHYAQGCILAKAGKYPEAVKEYVKSMEISPGYMTFGSLGNALFAMGRLPDAAQSYRRAIQLEPGKPDAYYNLAFVLEKMGDKAGAVAALKKLLEITPGDAEAQAMYRRLGGTP